VAELRHMARKAALAAARARLAEFLAERGQPGKPEHHCLLFALHLQHVLEGMGCKTVFQAGSSSWPRVRLPEEDDGVIDTHFSHVFDAQEVLRAALAGHLPEIHCWLAVPPPEGRPEAEAVLIDPTTSALPEKCRLTTGMAWTAPPPPAFLWCRVDRLPPGVLYQPDVYAIEVALDYGIAALTGRPLILAGPGARRGGG
jgi:hypothetical protein